MTRGYNFGAGPAMLPESLLIEAKEELLDWQDTGMSVMEIGHRTPEFMQLMEHAEQSLRQLLNIPNNYHVLFTGGAARTHFAMIPLNFLSHQQQAGYLVTGIWSEMALQEAQKLKSAYCIASGKSKGYIDIPAENEWDIRENTTYLYYVPNETVNGIRLSKPPLNSGLPVIADMTSCLLSELIDVTNYDLIFAGAQKNIANSGLTIVIVKDEWLSTIDQKQLPTMLDYRILAEHNSLYATPPTFNCYLADKMFQWIAKEGGVETLYKKNCEKSRRLYEYIDTSGIYHCKIAKEYRSLVNVCFSLPDPDLENKFLLEAQKRGLLALKGHRFVGGLRASMYNSMPITAVDQLIDFMRDFSKECVV